MNDPRGSVWRKWDLHVHTPASLVHNYSSDGSDIWDKYIEALGNLPPEFKVLGINDYIFLDGYKKLLAAKADGKLPNIDLLLPVIELRLDKFGGSRTGLSRVNYHVIFSDEVSVETIESQFLSALCPSYVLTPEIDALRKAGKWSGIPTRQSLEDLGRTIIESVPEPERVNYGSPLREGFNNLCVSLDVINSIVRSPYFHGKVLTAVGKTEWADIKWNDQSIADKKTIINSADLVFIASATAEECAKARKSLTDGGVNDRLLDCSDAHSYADSSDKDRLANCFTWIKADPTFEGLRQVINEPLDRSFIGLLPPKLAQVQNNKTKFIKTISLQRKENATLAETWFNNIIPLNPDLVAIIGNKGKGKSALADCIGLLCNTKQDNDILTFLSNKNFRYPKDNKSKHFEATLTWESGIAVTKGLDDSVDVYQPELVKYIPQNFLEKICTQLGRIEESDFDRELKKVIFSHVKNSEQLGKASLDELITFKTSEASVKIRLLKQEIHSLNENIMSIEDMAMPEHRQEIENLLRLKQNELEVHEKSKPEEVAKPENDPEKQKEIAEVSGAIERFQMNLAEREEQIVAATREQGNFAQLIATADRLLARIENLKHQLQAFSTESKADFDILGIQVGHVLQISFDKKPIEEKRDELLKQKSMLEVKLNPENEGSLILAKQKIILSIEQLKVKLDEPNKNFQTYQAALLEWENKKQEITGSVEVVGSVKYYEDQLSLLDTVPEQLTEHRGCRLSKSKEIHEVVHQLGDTYRELYAPVNQFIEKSPLAKERFQLNFEVAIVDSGFQEAFFEIISQGVSGTFCGIEEGNKMLKSLLALHDFDTDEGVSAFLEDMISALENDLRPNGKAVRVSDQLKKGKTKLMLYDMMFSLDYLKPRYALRMGDKELHQLSPGERGTLLLVFYLLVDKDDIPLVIDQPEENLDNQTVYELLVPCIKEAKQRRQIVIVTHNPNLAVVCDAEQIIFADLDKKNNYKMNYLSGAIENPKINRAIVDVLEGTMPAFENRGSKYLP
jgi:ABC-type lipoprotein export system ATPase subunit